MMYINRLQQIYCIWLFVTIEVVMSTLYGTIQTRTLSTREEDYFKNQAVSISIEALLTNHSTVTYNLNTVEQVQTITKNLPMLTSRVKLTVRNDSKLEINISLERNPLIISDSLVQRSYSAKTGKPITKKDKREVYLQSLCHYHQIDEQTHQILSSVSLCKGVRGFLTIYQIRYSVEPVIEGVKVTHRLLTKLSPTYKECDTHLTLDNFSTFTFQRVKREIHPPSGHTTNTQYIEVYVVIDYNLHRRLRSVTSSNQRAVDVISQASVLYKPLDIYLALVGIEVWSDENKIRYPPYKANPREIDGFGTLREFAKYRLYNINKHTINDNAQLLLDADLSATLIGIAGDRTMCSRTSSVGVSWDAPMNTLGYTAAVVAHEIGHSLGFRHTDYGSIARYCGCKSSVRPYAEESCLSHGTIANPPATQWSTCTLEDRRNNFDANIGQCLGNLPRVLAKKGDRPVCGNFFIEKGEDCDCGPTTVCANKCCQASTCKLASNAKCASGLCCDLDTCSLKKKGSICRSKANLECDLEEFCNGRSEWCPSDSHKRDGTPCVNISDAYCFNGRCNSHNSQCQFVFGQENALMANNSCYEHFNNNSNHEGNCGWGPKDVDSGDGTLEREFYKCGKESDKYCGLLHCQPNSKQDSIGKIRILNVVLGSGITVNNNKNNKCFSAAFDVGDADRDPGQVPNGAKCGEKRMCIDSVCTPIRNHKSLIVILALLFAILGTIGLLCTIIAFLAVRRRAVKKQVKRVVKKVRKKKEPPPPPNQVVKPAKTINTDYYKMGNVFNQNLDIPGFSSSLKPRIRPVAQDAKSQRSKRSVRSTKSQKSTKSKKSTGPQKIKDSPPAASSNSKSDQKSVSGATGASVASGASDVTNASAASTEKK